MFYLSAISLCKISPLYTSFPHCRLLTKRFTHPYIFQKTVSQTYNKSFRNFNLKPLVKMKILLSPKIFHNISVTVICRSPHKVKENVRYFHTSDRRYLHPAVWVVLRPVLKFVAILTGRAFRKWWRDLPPNKRKYFLERIKENKHKIIIFILTCIALSTGYYVSHLEETPITRRRRFIAFSPKQLEKINQFEYQQVLLQMQKDILPANHPSTRRVQGVVNRIVNANKDLEEMKGKKFGVAVINSSVENAFVLPNGFVCVFSGMLSLCSTDDELGVILSHEIAHCIQNHGAENVSHAHLLDLISLVIITAIWAIIPSDGLSILTHWLYNKFTKIVLELPYNRNIEAEADFVGLQLAAKACYDVRESSAFWAKMAVLQRLMGKAPDIEFLSTHPSHETRSEYLDSIMDQAISYRKACDCPRLKPVDPRLNIEIMAKAADAARRKYLTQFPKPAVPFHL